MPFAAGGNAGAAVVGRRPVCAGGVVVVALQPKHLLQAGGRAGVAPANPSRPDDDPANPQLVNDSSLREADEEVSAVAG